MTILLLVVIFLAFDPGRLDRLRFNRPFRIHNGEKRLVYCLTVIETDCFSVCFEDIFADNIHELCYNL